MKRFLAGLIITLFLCGCTIGFTPIANAYTVPYNENISYTYDDMDILIELIAEQISIADAAHQMANAARQLGYEENHEVIILAKQEYQEAERIKSSYQAVYDDLMVHWHQKEEEYPVATYIWSYLKDLGYSSQVRAGILGNIMAETGGNTLEVDIFLETKTYYGMCQWNKKLYPQVYQSSLEEQCRHLKETIKSEFNEFGYLYSRKFKYNDFLALDDAKDAALSFAKCYERCPPSSYHARQENAITAYNYFVS